MKKLNKLKLNQLSKDNNLPNKQMTGIRGGNVCACGFGPDNCKYNHEADKNSVSGDITYCLDPIYVYG